MVLRKWKTVVFVNGCFWHRHKRCLKASTPKSNVEFWESKFRTNMERDQRNYAALEGLGWKVVVVWQCEVKNLEEAKKVLKERVIVK